MYVLILVVVEDGLRGNDEHSLFVFNAVLILVVVEDGLRGLSSVQKQKNIRAS